MCNERISSLRIFRQQHFNERGLTGEGQNALTRRALLFAYIETCHRLCLCVQFSLYLHILSTAPQSIVTHKKSSMLYVAFPGFGLVHSRIENKIYLPAGSLWFPK